MVTVKMNTNWKSELEKVAIAGVKNRFQPVLDSVFESMNGRPVSEIKPVLAKKWAAANDGASVSDPELTKIAEAISAGTRVELK